MARIVVTNTAAAGASHELGGNWVTIGRADGNTFQIMEASISGRHCEVKMQGNELLVRDLLSTNGTFILGKKISEGKIMLGQTLRLGDVEFKLEASPKESETPGTSFTSKMLVTNASKASTKSETPPAAETKPEPKPAEPEPAKRFRILMVDDSLAFLEAFGDLCTEYSGRTWDIRSASSADKALAALQEKPMDLVTLDVGMPMLDGLQLLGIISRRYPEMKIVVMTGNATEAKRADALKNGAAMFMEKPTTPDEIRLAYNVLNDLVSWTHREGFSGSLRQVKLQEVIQMECLGRHSSVLEIHNKDLRGEVYIEDGSITHAVVGTLAGEQAFYRLMSMNGGEFHVRPFRAPALKTIETRWEFLLLDAARATDEETVMLAKPETIPTPASPPPPAAPTDKKPEEHETEMHALGEDIIVVAEYDGKWKRSDEQKPEPGKQ